MAVPKAVQFFSYAERKVTALIAVLMIKVDLLGKDMIFDHGDHTKTYDFQNITTSEIPYDLYTLEDKRNCILKLPRPLIHEISARVLMF